MFHVKFADIGEGIHEGVLLKLFFEEGDAVKEGDSLFTLETDKVNAEIPSPVSGVFKKNKFKVGTKVNVGDVIVIIDDGEPGIRTNMKEGEVIDEGDTSVDEPKPVDEAKDEAKDESKDESKYEAKVKDDTSDKDSETVYETVEEKGSTSVVGQIEVSEDVIPSSGEGAGASKTSEETAKVLATPVARKMAKDLGVDIKQIKGTGPQGRIMKADIQAAADAGHGQKSASESVQKTPEEKASLSAPSVERSGGGVGNYAKYAVPKMDRVNRVPMTMHRKAIAANMSLSKFTIPHTAVMDEIDVTDLVAFRESSKLLAQQEGAKLTYLAFFIKAVISGLKAYPGLNASLDEVAEEIVYKQFYNIGIAVDTPEGLMVPVIKDADRKSILEIAHEIEDLSERARNKSLKLEELSGGSFTITNYGAVGASFGVPVIKHPEAGILGVGMIVKKPVVKEDEIVIRSILPVSMSFDHRIIDGADAGRFVGHVKKLLSNPSFLLMN